MSLDRGSNSPKTPYFFDIICFKDFLNLFLFSLFIIIMVIISDIQLPKNADGILKVSDVSTSADSDLSARQTITDPTTSTFVKTDADGRLNVLESSVEGVGADNSLNATQYAVKQVGAFDGSAFRSVKCSNVGRLEVDINSGGGSVALKAGNDTNNSMAAVGVFGSINGTADYRSIQVDSAGALLVRADNSNDSIRIVGQNSAGANKGVGVEDTDGGILSAGKVVVAEPSSADGSRQVMRLNTRNELLVFADNLWKQIFVDQGIASGQGEILPSTGLAMNNGSGSNVEVYINYGGASGATAGDFTFQVHESWDNTDYYLTSSATFGQVLQNVDAITPKAVKTGMFQFDGRFLKVKVVNNSGNPQDINAWVYAKK